LINFIEKFKQVDTDQNGIVDEVEFRKLIKVIDSQNEMGIKIDVLLDILDPFSNDIITFSSIVTLLSSVD
jgi:Ca2+-binding EF-hand superfamily protein